MQRAKSYTLRTGDPLHSHAHHHGPATGSILRWSLAATFAFVVVEVVRRNPGPLPGPALRRRA